jgi:TPR repeat protein
MLNADDEVDAGKYRPSYDALSAEEQASAEKRAKELCGEREYASAFARDPAELEKERKHFALTKQRAEQGDREAQYRLGLLLDSGEGAKQDAAEAIRWFRQAADKGHAEAQFSLGWHYASGEGVDPDPQAAFRWFTLAANQGDVDGESAVGRCLQNGEGVKADPVEGKKWTLRAAEHGHAMAQWETGRDHFDKKPDLARDAIAARWFRKSAEQLEPRALISLGYCYRLGRGVPEDKIEGLAWMAIGKYDDDQEKMVARFFDECSEEELAKVDERAATLKKECRDKFMAKLAAKKK